MPPLRVVFMGSPEFALPSLHALLENEHVLAVVTQPDKPTGRGQKMVSPPVKLLALERGVPVLQPKSARSHELHAELQALNPDLLVVVAYGKILPQSLLDIPRFGCLNVHGSVLPRYRGAAPIQWALIRGETETGITIMKLDAGMDTGPMLIWRKAAIQEADTAGTLATRLADIGAELLVVALVRLQAGTLVEIPQEGEQATYAPLLTKESGEIDWKHTAAQVRNLVRGVDPWPVATTLLAGEVLKVWGAKIVPGVGKPGEVLGTDKDGLIVACGEGAVALAEVQVAGRRRMHAAAFVSGRPIPPGTVLGT